jgi:hypothetical protein
MVGLNFPGKATGRAPSDLPTRAATLRAVDALIDRARTPRELERHGLQVLAVHRYRALGRSISPRLLAQERLAGALSLAAPAALERIRAAYDGALLLVKGPEAAVAYPDPAARPYGDLDLLASDPRGAQRALLAAGFEPLGDEQRYSRLHHLQPLRPPGLPLLVELHKAPKWPNGLAPPSTAELLDAARPARCGAEGILGLSAARHAIILAAHAWAHGPLGHLRQLLDIALVAADAEPAEMRRLAGCWGASALWDATVATLRALFGGSRRPATLRLWARHLASVRERTVFEAHLTSWLSPLWCCPRPQGVRAATAAFAADLRPLPEESWREKLARVRLALAEAASSAAQHDRVLRAASSDAMRQSTPVQGVDRP